MAAAGGGEGRGAEGTCQEEVRGRLVGPGQAEAPLAASARATNLRMFERAPLRYNNDDAAACRLVPH